jgi:hypothetical protein
VKYGYDTDTAAKQVAAGKGVGKVSDKSQRNGCFLEFGRKIEKLALEWKSFPVRMTVGPAKTAKGLPRSLRFPDPFVQTTYPCTLALS